MTIRHSANIPTFSQEHRWPSALAALIVGIAFFSLWFWLLPRWLGFDVEAARAAR